MGTPFSYLNYLNMCREWPRSRISSFLCSWCRLLFSHLSPDGPLSHLRRYRGIEKDDWTPALSTEGLLFVCAALGKKFLPLLQRMFPPFSWKMEKRLGDASPRCRGCILDQRCMSSLVPLLRSRLESPSVVRLNETLGFCACVQAGHCSTKRGLEKDHDVFLE